MKIIGNIYLRFIFGNMMLSLANLDLFTNILGGWVGRCGWKKIENKVHLRPAEAETRTELGKIRI